MVKSNTIYEGFERKQLGRSNTCMRVVSEEEKRNDLGTIRTVYIHSGSSLNWEHNITAISLFL